MTKVVTLQYQKAKSLNERVLFSHRVRVKGLGNVPIVVEYFDDTFKEFVIHMDMLSKELINFFTCGGTKKITLHVIDKSGTRLVLKGEEVLGDLYKKYCDKEDYILYLFLSEANESYIGILWRFIYKTLLQK